MKNRIVIFIWFLGIFYSCKIYSQSNQVDSIKIVSLDAGWTYIPFGSYTVDWIKDLLDDKVTWKESGFEPNSKIEYKCVLTNRKLINRFEQLLSKCDTSSYMDLSNFLRIHVRIGLKIYKGSQIEYMFIQPKASDYFDKFILTETTELRASNALIRFLKKMKRKQRCNRC